MINIQIEENKDLFPYLTLRTKTIARYFFTARSKEDLQAAKKYSLEHKLPLLILGGGSNLALLSDIYDGLVVKNDYKEKELLQEDEKSTTLRISSGYPMTILVNETIEAGIGGFEYQKGLPGTLGGAIAMNSKWMKPVHYVSDYLQSATLLDKNGEFKTVDYSYFQFAYDYSILKKTGEIFVEGIFHCPKTDKLILEQHAKEAIDYRLQNQPKGVSTCGCFFRNISVEEQKAKNLSTTSVGYLIDSLGLKDFQIGGFAISDKHANFIINKGDGKPEDLMKLLSIIKEKVKEKYGIEIEEEVILV